jgi:fructose-bisphosphate aldolase class I
MPKSDIRRVAESLVAPGKGILAADESFPTIKKRFDSIGIKSTKETRRAYRELLFTTPDIEKFISGVILFDETLRQKAKNGKSFPKLLTDRGIIVGIKVDQGKVALENSPNEMITQGLDGLRERLLEYSQLGAKFTKWRAVYSINKNTPSDVCIEVNAEGLARFAALSQETGLAPIVEPEVLMKGDHAIERSAGVSKKVLKAVFLELEKHKVDFKGMLLKPSWIHPGFDYPKKPNSKIVAQATLRVFREVLPDELPGVVFLSGGDSPEDSTTHLDALNELDRAPWQLSFSFGRALQQPALKAWAGKSANIEKAQKAFYERARLNSLARSGDY